MTMMAFIEHLACWLAQKTGFHHTIFARAFNIQHVGSILAACHIDRNQPARPEQTLGCVLTRQMLRRREEPRVGDLLYHDQQKQLKAWYEYDEFLTFLQMQMRAIIGC